MNTFIGLFWITLLPATAQSEPIVSVTRSGESYQINVRIDVTGSRNLVWRVLTDYENLPRFVPGMQSSRVVSGRGEPLLLEQKVNQASCSSKSQPPQFHESTRPRRAKSISNW